MFNSVGMMIYFNFISVLWYFDLAYFLKRKNISHKRFADRSMSTLVVCGPFIFQAILMNFIFFLFLIKFSICNMPTVFKDIRESRFEKKKNSLNTL